MENKNENHQNNSVPYIAHEAMMVRIERINRRLFMPAGVTAWAGIPLMDIPATAR
jgi:hypothetical protein